MIAFGTAWSTPILFTASTKRSCSCLVHINLGLFMAICMDASSSSSRGLCGLFDFSSRRGPESQQPQQQQQQQQGERERERNYAYLVCCDIV
mmetsp:Transcript_11042/g.23060  ORF Transcript_11042/g.23060 Transcript_11042/m.23060 type:complete len:92 (+) Transcript_11042:2110-2385(+)